ncbi:uncharacterized protein LOC144605685 isoform X2 [Rhinoraja longicauda]
MVLRFSGGERNRWVRDTKMSESKVVIKNADMPEEMQQEAVECGTQAPEKYNIEKDIAAYIKKCGGLSHFGFEPSLVGLELSHGLDVTWADQSRGRGGGPSCVDGEQSNCS